MIHIYSFSKIAKITDRVAALEHEEAARRLASTTKTVNKLYFFPINCFNSISSCSFSS